MGVDYKALLYLGKLFEDSSEAQDFYEKYVTIPEEGKEVIDEDGFEEFMCDCEDIEGEVLNCYNGYGFILGVDLSYPNPNTFKDDFAKAEQTWRKYFKDDPYELINAVKVS